MSTAAVAQNSQIAKLDKATLAQRWIGLKNKLAKAKEVGTEIATKALQVGTTFTSFSALYYWRVRRKLAGKRNTFDQAGKVDAFFWPGLAAAVLGVTPLLGEAGRYVSGAGVGAMCVGATEFIEKMATEHHNKKS